MNDGRGPITNGGAGWQRWALTVVTAIAMLLLGGMIGRAVESSDMMDVRDQVQSAATIASANAIRLDAQERDYARIQQELVRLNAKLDRLIESGR